MSMHENGFFPQVPEDAKFATHALGVVTAIAVVLGFSMVAAWFALLVMDERGAAPQAGPAARAEPAPCNICGMVDRVNEIAPAPEQALEGSRAEGTVILLAALGGAARPGDRPDRIYETSVIHDDGSVRVLRDAGAPPWKPGDRVKVIKGRVEPDASPEERTPIPGPQAARGW